MLARACVWALLLAACVAAPTPSIDSRAGDRLGGGREQALSPRHVDAGAAPLRTDDAPLQALRGAVGRRQAAESEAPGEPLLAVLVGFVRPDGSAVYPACNASCLQTMMWSADRSVAGSLLDSSGGLLRIPAPPASRIVSVLTTVAVGSECAIDAWADAALALAATAHGVDANAFTFRVFLLPEEVKCDFSATSARGCSRTTCRAWVKVAEATVIAHELAHNLGLGPAGLDRNNDGVAEESAAYSDLSCIMGVSNAVWKRFNAVHRFALGWLAASAVVTVDPQDSDRVLTLHSASLAEVPPDATQLAEVLTSGDHSYWISYRTRAAATYDRDLLDGWHERVYIHRWRPLEGTTLLVRKLAVGEFFYDTTTGVFVEVRVDTPKIPVMLASADGVEASDSSHGGASGSGSGSGSGGTVDTGGDDVDEVSKSEGSAPTSSVLVSITRCLPAAPVVSVATPLVRPRLGCAAGLRATLSLTLADPSAGCGTPRGSIVLLGLPDRWSFRGVSECVAIQVTIVSDAYPWGTTWDIVRSDMSLFASGVDAANATLSHCGPRDEALSFTIRSQFGVGLCCSFGIGSYAVTVNGDVVAAGAEFTDFETTAFTASPRWSRGDAVDGQLSGELVVPAGVAAVATTLRFVTTTPFGTATGTVLVDCSSNGDVDVESRSCVPQAPVLSVASSSVRYSGVCGDEDLLLPVSASVSNPSTDCDDVDVAVSLADLPDGWLFSGKQSCQELQVIIVPDEAPEDVSWSLEYTTSSDVVTSGVLAANASMVLCGAVDRPLRFRIQDASGDGLCCGRGHGSYTVTLGDEVVASGDDFGASHVTEFPSVPTWYATLSNAATTLVARDVTVPQALLSDGATVTQRLKLDVSSSRGASFALVDVHIECLRVTHSPSRTPSPSATPSPASLSRTASKTPSRSRTPSRTVTKSKFSSDSRTPTKSLTPTVSVTRSDTKSPSLTKSTSLTPSTSKSLSSTPSVTRSRSLTASSSRTPTRSRTISRSASVSVTRTRTRTHSRSRTPSKRGP